MYCSRQIFQLWWQAARPPFYIATIIPILLAVSVAHVRSYEINGLVLFGVFFICFLLHLAANLGNDYFDFLQGVDTPDTLGGSGILTSGRVTIPQLKRVLAGIYGLIVLSLAIGVGITGLPNLIGIVVFAAFSSYFYVAPPIRYGYRALGELLVFVNMGPVMSTGAFYAITGVWSASMVALSVPIGLMVAGILYYQSLPEIETDASAGKRTLATTLGPIRAVFLLQLWWPLIWAFIVVLWLCGQCNWPVFLGILGSVPLHIRLCRLVGSGGDWERLDTYGSYVRKMYLLCGIFLIVGVLAA